MAKYYIYNLDAEAMINHFFLEWDTSTNNRKFVYRDPETGAGSRSIVRLKALKSSNALFDQLIEIGSLNAEDRDALIDKILIVDFGRTLSGRYLADDMKLLIEEGFNVVYGSGTEERTVHFDIFDKSQSMSRQSRVTFLDASYREELDERLRLHIPYETFMNAGAALSKYYAYRGLYLTDSTRVESKDLDLNEKTVIVLKEPEYETAQYRFIEAVNNGADFMISPKTIKMAGFDGEGLIDPEYSMYLSKALPASFHESLKKPSTSWQIRMPYGKGMLHRVDFHAFLNEYGEGKEPGTITDYFGIERNMEDVHIILLESMLKCAKWLKQRCTEIGEEDPMRCYFNEFRNCHHAMYIASDDRRMVEDKNETEMNYQLLNTLDMPRETFETLIKKQYEKIRCDVETKDTEKLRKLLLDTEVWNVDEEDGEYSRQDDEIEDDGQYENRNLAPWQYALQKYPDFIYAPYFRTQLLSVTASRMYKAAIGRISVEGGLRYLSHDLLRLLYRIGEAVYGLKNENVMFLEEDEMYMPDTPAFKTEENRSYSVWRNPHLSRSEECLLKSRKDDEYDKWFKDLRGVVMIACDSIIPNVLGGADYDGDTVRVIADPMINKAVKDGAYKDGKRRYPVPIYGDKSVKDDMELTVDDYRKIPYITLKNTFDNMVGIISNNAVRYARYEYFENRDPEKDTDECVKYTIAVGLEIDAAKHGKHPDLNHLPKPGQRGGPDHLRFKEDIAEVKKLGPANVLENRASAGGIELMMYDMSMEEDVHNPFYVIDPNTKPNAEGSSLITVAPTDDWGLPDVSNIDMLGTWFAEQLWNPIHPGITTADNKEEMKKCQFPFDEPKNCRKAPCITSITKAYLSFDRARKARERLFRDRQKKYESKAYTILNTYFLIKGKGTTYEAINRLNDILTNALKTQEKADEMVAYLNENRWHYMEPETAREVFIRHLCTGKDKDGNEVFDERTYDNLMHNEDLDVLFEPYRDSFMVTYYLLKSLSTKLAPQELQYEGTDALEKEVFENLNDCYILGTNSGMVSYKLDKLYVRNLRHAIEEEYAKTGLPEEDLFRYLVRALNTISAGTNKQRLFWNLVSVDDIEKEYEREVRENQNVE